MRKLIVLIMTSVLATGAVANADQVTVSENPGNYINVQGIYDARSTDDPAGVLVSGDLQPSKSVSESYNPYFLRLQVLEPSADTLNQIAVCLYDSASVTGAEMRTVCGDGFPTPGLIGANGAGLANEEGLDRPQMAHSFVFVPIRHDPAEGNNGVLPGVDQQAGNDYHLIAPSGTSDLSSKVDDTGTTFPAVTSAGDTVWDLEFMFALNYKARQSDTWKIRVLATYNDTTEIELLDTEDYGVAYFGEIATRTSVTYPDVVDGGQTSDLNIPTGQYTANGKSDVTLQAGLFQIENDVNSPLSMGDTNSPPAGEVSLACVEKGNTVDSLDFFSAIDASADSSGTSSLTLLSNIAASNENDDDNAQSPITPSRHACTLYVGDDVPAGTYDNDMTVGIGAYTP